MVNEAHKPGSSTTACPKCGFRQEAGHAECMSCGVIFARCRPRDLPGHPAPQEPERPPVGPFRRVYRILRWSALAVTIIAFALILRNPAPPEIETTPGAVQKVETKLSEFQATRDSGAPATLRLDEAELNALVRSRLPSGDEAAPSASEGNEEVQADPTVEQVRSNVRDIRLQLDGDNISAYVLFDLHGKEISLVLEGKLEVRDGCLRMIPTSGKLGSLPLMESTLKGAVSRLFDSAENRDKFCLPPGIRDVRIEESSLVVASR